MDHDMLFDIVRNTIRNVGMQKQFCLLLYSLILSHQERIIFYVFKSNTSAFCYTA